MELNRGMAEDQAVVPEAAVSPPVPIRMAKGTLAVRAETTLLAVEVGPERAAATWPLKAWEATVAGASRTPYLGPPRAMQVAAGVAAIVAVLQVLLLMAEAGADATPVVRMRGLTAQVAAGAALVRTTTVPKAARAL